MMIGCFWVSGKYKKNGHGKALLQKAVTEARRTGKDGLVTVAGTKKFHFMSDSKWLIRQGFKVCENIASGFSLLSMDFNKTNNKPHFNDSVKRGTGLIKKGICAYFTNRCPYSEYHVKESLTATAQKRSLPLTAIKLETMEQAQAAPTPATIFSLFMDGKFVTTDISVCMDSRFDKIIGKAIT